MALGLCLINLVFLKLLFRRLVPGCLQLLLFGGGLHFGIHQLTTIEPQRTRCVFASRSLTPAGRPRAGRDDARPLFMKYKKDAVNRKMVLGGLRPRLEMTDGEFCRVFERKTYFNGYFGFMGAMNRALDEKLQLAPLSPELGGLSLVYPPLLFPSVCVWL